MTLLQLVTILLLSPSPLGEHKIAMPLAIGWGLDPITAWAICISLNMISPPLIWWFLQNVNHKLIRFDTYRKYAFKLARYSKKKLGNGVDKYGFWGIMIFIMIPLPMTGSYTGLVAAWMVGLHKKPALLSAFLGLILSSVIMLAVIQLFGLEMAKSIFG